MTGTAKRSMAGVSPERNEAQSDMQKTPHFSDDFI